MKRPKPFQGIKKFVARRRPSIKEVVREPTAGGIVFRRSQDKKLVEILLIQDAKNRWTIPKGHIEEGEQASQTAEREIREETGLPVSVADDPLASVVLGTGKMLSDFRLLRKIKID